MAEHEVHIQPDGLRITVSDGTVLTDAMHRAGIALQLTCGGKGTCGKCRVELHPDLPEPTEDDVRHISEDDLARGVRLACRTVVDRPLRVLVGSELRALAGKILVDGAERDIDLDPSVEKRFLELPTPSLEDQAADLFRIKRAIAPDVESCPPVDIDVLRELPDILRTADFRTTVVTTNGRIVAVEPGDTTGRRYGLAVDLGTTTLVGTVLDLSDGRVLAHASRLNAQMVHGEDTISRITYALQSPDSRDDLTAKVRGDVNEIIAEAAERAGIDQDEIYEATFAGNTTMSHLFLGLDPGGLSQIPFVPVTNAAVNLRASDVGIAIHPRGNLHILPNIAGFVGSDTVAAMLACDFLEEGPSRLLVDVGTNGELALRHGDTLIVCSTAAGPALEGAALSCGMRAANGAIEHCGIGTDDFDLAVIGGGDPVGLCGSGIIDILATLLDAGIVDSYGGIAHPDALPDSAPAFLKDRIVDDGSGQPAVLLARGDDSSGRRDVVITQRDIRQIQLAKGAISAGIVLLLDQAGLGVDDLSEIVLAGAFGNYITTESARRIGLLPQIPTGRIRFVGNAASTGARMALLSRAARRDADLLRHRTTHLELATLPAFMNTLTDSMLFE
jgi:uncharacterized 2Fe-2S/4Fe-4S cluster protein (DUF4445 family)